MSSNIHSFQAPCVFINIMLCCVLHMCLCFPLQCDFQVATCFSVSSLFPYFLWHCDVIDVALKFFMFWTFKCYCENLTRGDEKSCKDKLLLHHNCFSYNCNGPYNLAMLVTMLLKLLLASWICCCCFNYAFNFNLFQFGVTQPLQYVPTFACI